MHHHRLALSGPAAAVARLADDLVAAGATALSGGAPVHVVWATGAADAPAAVCARHRRVAVGVERFAFLGDTLERLVLQGRVTTVLERRPIVCVAEHDGGDDDGGPDPPPRLPRGLCLGDDCAPLSRAALRAAARRVAALPVDLGPGLAGSALDDALLVGAAAGRVCAQATAPAPDPAGSAHPLGADPRAAGTPAPSVLDAVVALAAAALTASAACSGPACPAELAYERALGLTEATTYAALEPLWARPGDADWPEWLMDLLATAAAVVEDCAACLHQPPPPYASIHTERLPTDAERLQESAGRLVTTSLQALVLFDA
jgi:hypothetical protein